MPFYLGTFLRINLIVGVTTLGQRHDICKDFAEQTITKSITQRTLAETLHVAVRYLTDIENVGTIPSLPVLIQLIRICRLPAERYFNPVAIRDESELRQRVSHKLKLYPEEY